MKPVTNTRRVNADGSTVWLLRRVVGSCEHAIVVTYGKRPSRLDAANRIWRARRQLHIACEQQRDAIRIQQQTHYLP